MGYPHQHVPRNRRIGPVSLFTYRRARLLAAGPVAIVPHGISPVDLVDHVSLLPEYFEPCRPFRRPKGFRPLPKGPPCEVTLGLYFR
jgi:hypothetical protein